MITDVSLIASLKTSVVSSTDVDEDLEFEAGLFIKVDWRFLNDTDFFLLALSQSKYHI